MASNGNGKNSNLGTDWTSSPRWAGITRPYTGQDVERLRGSVHIEHTLALTKDGVYVVTADEETLIPRT